MFDGRDGAALAQARDEWRRLKDQGRTISYSRESDEGGWNERGKFGFLAPGRFATNFAISGYWISFEFLGFSPSKLRLINDLHGIFAGSFFSAVVPRVWRAETRAYELGMREDRLVMGQAYLDF